MKKNKILACGIQVFFLVILIAGCASPATSTTAPTQESQPVTATNEPTAIPQAVATETSAPTQAEPTAATQAASLPASLDGRWEGSLNLAGSSLGMAVQFRSENGKLTASLDIPPQNLFGYQLAGVTFEKGIVHFEGFEEIGRKAVWEGQLTEEGKISGTFSQVGYTGSFDLTSAALVESNEAPPPYIEEEVAVKNGEISLGGTLSIPEGEGTFPVVVLITGSGPQNRDEEIFGFKLFRVIADHLTRSGIAVLRYDDRGVGASTGDIINSTSKDFAGDVVAWVDFLKTRPEINPEMIGLMGHSEGGIVAPLAASQSSDVAFLVLMAGTAVSGEEIIYKQVEMIARAAGTTEDEIQKSLEMQRRVFDGLIRGQDWEGAKASMRQEIVDQMNALPDIQKQALGNLDQYIEMVYQQQLDSLESAWYRYFLEYDPAPVLEQTSIPVLAFFGGLDVQVPADQNAEKMKAALELAGNMDVTVITYPKANHLFQEAVTGSPDEYATLKQEYIPGFLDDLTNWLLDHTAAAR